MYGRARVAPILFAGKCMWILAYASALQQSATYAKLDSTIL